MNLRKEQMNEILCKLHKIAEKHYPNCAYFGIDYFENFIGLLDQIDKDLVYHKRQCLRGGWDW